MLSYLAKKIIHTVKIFISYVAKYKIFLTYFTAFLAFLLLLSELGWLDFLINWLTNFFISTWQFFSSNPLGLPNLVLIIIGIWIIWITYKVLKQDFDLSIVAGTFDENFKHGLENWDYSGNWKIVRENGKPVLSISGRESEGITKKGFTWSDYEFSFETKIVKKASGWIIRAAERNRFFMLQIYMDNIDNPKLKGPMLRPHYREIYNKFNIIWIPLDKDSVSLSQTQLPQLKLLQWIKVRIVVRGGDMDVYINEVHVFKYNLYKTGLTNIPKKQIINGKETELTIDDPIIVGDYRLGSVGFREASDEEALFRNVEVKPLH